MSDSLISIITPNYNSEKFVAECLNSVINQTYKHWEMLIIDDCSTDDSIAIIQKYSALDTRISLIQLSKNSGPAIARNNGIEAAKGSFLTFIDSDDVWLPHFLESSLKFEKKSEGFVFASYHRYNEAMKPLLKDFIVPKKVNYQAILKTNSISCLTAFINIEKLGKLYMPKVRYRQDMGLWLQYLKKIKYAIGIEQPLAIYRIRQASHSRNKLKLIKHQWNFYRRVTHLSVLKSAYYFGYWLFNGIKKYYL